MREKLRAYIEDLFAKYPGTHKIMEFKEELLSNLTEKYDDLITQGRSEQDAYNIAIGGIGDVDELIRGLENEKVYNYARQESDRRRSAAFVSVAVGLYIVSVAFVVLFSIVPGYGPEIGVVLMFVTAAIATGLLVFNVMSRPKYHRADDTIVEEFKEWKHSSSQDRQLYHSVTSAMWSIIVALYLIVSFAFGAWPYSWIIFIIGAAVQNIIKLCFETGKRR